MDNLHDQAVGVEEFLRLVRALPEAQVGAPANYVGIKVRGKGFAYLQEDTGIALVKVTMEEREALVGQDPETFARSYTSGRFGWVQIRLDMVPPDELAELVTEAWCLTAPRRLVEEYEAAG
ncbi:MmcQ/YjbR family DNA-binding protein [Microtetraspora sp. AC03309]|uniref:MmcQ/YjbR family DNA-binding protein n=1 Tax=Microtetraspora sp. AC03309 TaxID=2779376 RepID=UPI001E454C4B|nr:MmcQ/YjbR family DNA-binding protein [Microtetraspora sp. AC03309]MCC5574429.1 MmcQ/YjbR family DNA-binding protein [Microtetraspora sp. AC03309]